MYEPLSLGLTIYLVGYIIAFLIVRIAILENKHLSKDILPTAIVSLASWIVPLRRLYLYLKYN